MTERNETECRCGSVQWNYLEKESTLIVWSEKRKGLVPCQYVETEDDLVERSIFHNLRFKKLIVGKNITRLGAYSFCNLQSLEAVSVSPILRSIENNAFFGCCRLSSFSFFAREDGNNVRMLGVASFAHTNVDLSIFNVPQYQLEWAKYNIGKPGVYPFL